MPVVPTQKETRPEARLHMTRCPSRPGTLKRRPRGRTDPGQKPPGKQLVSFEANARQVSWRFLSRHRTATSPVPIGHPGASPRIYTVSTDHSDSSASAPTEHPAATPAPDPECSPGIALRCARPKLIFLPSPPGCGRPHPSSEKESVPSQPLGPRTTPTITNKLRGNKGRRPWTAAAT